jgi:glycosyltransferase involved in cell wall biosynthesis
MAASPQPRLQLDERPVVLLFRSPVFNPSETFIQLQAAGLSRFQPLILGLEDKGNIAPELAGRVLYASARERLALKLAGRCRALAQRLRVFRPKLVHAHFAPDGLIALPLARALDAPLVTTLHGHDVARPRRGMLMSGRLSRIRYALAEARLQRSGDLFLAVSEALRRKAIGRGFPAERTLTHHIGADLALFAPSPQQAEPGLVLHVGRLVEKKGTAVLLEAFARVRRAGHEARLTIVGDGPLRAPLERQCAALGLAGNVEFLGARPQSEIAVWMRRAWLLAAPSVAAADGDSEGLPTVVVEAAASALPVVGTVHSGIPEAVIDGETGFLVPERDVAALAERIGALLGSAELRHRMGAAGRRLAEARFDAARQTAQLEAQYRALLDARVQD